jgi:CDP-diacylglycerol--glycerol-3-phosphate 3-phosphatidyltransferase
MSAYTLGVGANQMDDVLRVRWQDIRLWPNLVSLSRVLITPLVGYYLARDDSASTTICASLLIVAAATDGLDGYLARRLKMRSGLGLILDPLADKLFAAVLLIELVLFRGLPIWLAAVIIGRDLLIAVSGMMVMRKRKVSLASNIVGQYTFFSILLLLGFYIIKFQFGIRLMSIATMLLILASLISYARRLIVLFRGIPTELPPDKKLYKTLRVSVTAIILAICVVMLVLEKWR